MRCWVFCLTGGSLLLALGSSVTWGDEESARESLVGKGLSRKASYYVLASEIEFSRALSNARKVRGSLREALENQQAFERQKQQHRGNMRRLIAERRRLNRQLAGVRNVLENNRLIARINELNTQIERYSVGSVHHEEEQHRELEVGRARQEYLKETTKLRRLADQTNQGYTRLAEDPEVVAALAEINQTRKRPVSLGPRPIFARHLKQLRKLESAITTEKIALKPQIGVMWVDVSLNGTASKAMIFDTGESFITLPAELAAPAGLHPTENDPIVYMVVADGRRVEARRMVLESVRLAEFTVHNIDCLVLPTEAKEALPLLGGSFLRHFIFQVDQTARVLTMSRVDPTAKTP